MSSMDPLKLMQYCIVSWSLTSHINQCRPVEFGYRYVLLICIGVCHPKSAQQLNLSKLSNSSWVEFEWIKYFCKEAKRERSGGCSGSITMELCTDRIDNANAPPALLLQFLFSFMVK